MITPIHIVFNLGIFSLINKINITDAGELDLFFLLSAELIDLDHFLSRPIYNPKRNSFEVHPLHKNWKIILIVSVFLVSYRPTMFLGIGLVSHIFLDYCHNKIRKIKNHK